jgi:SAM-dependent methyltransferase
MPFKDNTFDLVYNSGVIEHFQEPDNVEAIREMGRVTKANGKVIVIVPNSLCLWYRMAKFTAVVLKGFEFGYEEDYTPGRLRSAVGAAGLIPEGTFGLQVLPPLATNDRELLPEPYRKKMVELEKHFCHKENYAYAVGIIARKEI